MKRIITIAIALLVLAPAAAQAHPPLSDATSEPQVLVYVHSDARHTFARQCPHGGFFSSVSAYRWTGEGLDRRSWTRMHDVMRWHDGREGGNVWFNGVSVRNRTARPILFAGWCD